MKISVVIPAHNEEKTIKKTVKSVHDVLKRTNYDYEIIVIDDNSNDETGKIIDKLSMKNQKIKSFHVKNIDNNPRGIGYAIRIGFDYSSGDVFIPFMGDLSDNPKDILKLVNKISEGYDIVCGSRFIEGSSVIDYPFLKLLFNRIYNLFFAFLFRLRIKDISNNFKAYRKEVISVVNPSSNGFEIASEIVLKSHIKGLKVVDIPVDWKGRNNGESKFNKLLTIGFSYIKLSLLLWLIFITKKLRERFYELEN